ncbi:aminopeptidase P family protein [Dyadobacter jejuensis]|nr:aminopeptidase P family protein [Dyadobacter jejuensis]
MFSKQTYISRRQVLQQKMGSGLLLFLGNDDSGMNYRDNIYPYRQDSTFLYFFGIDSPGLYAAMDVDTGEQVLFGDELTLDDIVWTGPKPSLQEQAARVGVSQVLSSKAFFDYVAKAVHGGQAIHFLPPYRAEHTLKLQALLGMAGPEIPTRVSAAFIRAIVSMRAYKSEEEVAEIEKAVNTSVDMHLHFMQQTRPTMTELTMAGQLQALAIGGGGNISYPVILTVNGEILHTHARDLAMQEGQLALCDAGAETAMRYCGDLTRTIPVGKGFTSVQKEMYQIVLDAQMAAIQACKPGVLFKDIHALACLRLLEGLKGQGIIKGDPQEALAADVHTLFFQCGLGHMMGMDVHDMENLGEQLVGYGDDLQKSTDFGWKSLRLGRALEPGFVVTVEPGLYFIPTQIDQWKAENRLSQFIDYSELEKYRDFSGIRIEDDLVITESGNRVLGKPLPKTISEIEALRRL